MCSLSPTRAACSASRATPSPRAAASVALALTDLFLEKLGKGICRIHGGGFAGVIMCVVPEDETENYVSYISEFAGKENVYPMNIRAVGAVHIEK